jgi:hypothetical protein
MREGESMARRKPKTTSEVESNSVPEADSKSKAEAKWTPREVEAVEKICTQRTEGVPRLRIKKSAGKSSIVTERGDNLVGTALVMEAIGTTDLDFYGGFVMQLAKASGREVDEQLLNFMLSVVKGIKPQDQTEAMLAAQMAATHLAMMKFSQQMADADCIEQRDSAERSFNRLARTFVIQMEGLKRHRGGSEQAVMVGQVNVGEGGQAIVGNVTQVQRDGVPRNQPLVLVHDETLPTSLLEGREAVAIPREEKKK